VSLYVHSIRALYKRLYNGILLMRPDSSARVR
jgi:hypothetical protein